MKKLFFGFMLAAMLLPSAYAQNVALGKKCTASATPDYPLTSKDCGKLTDGKRAPYSCIWQDDKFTVGWSRNTLDLTIDLEKSSNFSSVRYSTMAGCSDVGWPKNVLVFCSDDQKDYWYAGDLATTADLSGRKDGKAFVYTGNVVGHGRYILLKVAVEGSYIFCDEIEVIGGGNGKNGPAVKKENIGEFIANLFVPPYDMKGDNLARKAKITFPGASGNGVLNDGVFAAGAAINLDTAHSQSIFGWSPFQMDVDLGQKEPISQILLSSQIDGLVPFTSIAVFGSADNKNWYRIGDLTDSLPEKIENKRVMYGAGKLKTTARYLRMFLISRTLPRTFYFDELMIEKGDPAWLDEYLAFDDVASIDIAKADALTAAGQRNRMKLDLVKLGKAMADKPEMLAKVTAIKDKVGALPQPKAEGFSTVIPQNAVHAEMFDLYAEYLQDKKLPEIYSWSDYRYVFPEYFTLPPLEAKQKLDFKVLKNASRGELLNILYTRPGKTENNIVFEGDAAVWKALDIFLLPWTDTAECIPVSTVMQPLAKQGNKVVVKLQGGLPSRLWIRLDGKKLLPGTYQAELNVGGKTIAVAATVSSVEMKTPRLKVGTWDYTNSMPALALGEKNLASAIAIMDQYHISVPWGGYDDPFPNDADFDANGNFIGKIVSKNFESWIAQRPGKEIYCIFVNVEMTKRQNIGNAAYGTPEFAKRAASWIKAWDNRYQELGMKPGQVRWLLVDEVLNETKMKISVAWSKAMRDAHPVILRNFEDPILKPDKPENQEFYSLLDTISPARDWLYNNNLREPFLKLREQGKELWTYSCNGPSRLFDPFSYYKMHGLGSFRDGIEGIGFWAFADNAGGKGYNEYLCVWAIFALAHVSDEEVLSTLELEAVREGVEDNEMLRMLDEAMPKMSPEKQQEAKQLLQELDDYVVKNTQIHIKWFDAANLDRPGADVLMNRVFEMLNP